ncbi:ABC transporter permease [Yimella sp. cx-51]|uniref:ABC transporter permease n=1 Tax=Yimella sp. cx-51 TaxID=2770551 RepID=UPI00351C3D83
MIPQKVWQWFTDGATWAGETGILNRLQEHVVYSLITVLIAAAIGIPLGTWIAHTGRMKWLIAAANAARAIPSLGLLFVAAAWAAPRLSGDLAFTAPSIFVLVLLAIPPILAGAHAGVSEVDPAARDAAKGMGMTGGQVFSRVELPNALPLIFSGVRSATLQVIATATIAASVGLGGLGRYLIDGLAQQQYEVMVGGSLLVAALALLIDLIFALVQRRVVSPGLTGRTRRSARTQRKVLQATGSAR